jgi:hypothetical protein
VAKLYPDDRHSVALIADLLSGLRAMGPTVSNERSAETVGVEDAEDDASGLTRS